MKLRFPPDTHARLAAAAERDHRSMTAQVLWFVERGLDEREAEQRKAAG